MPTCLITRVRAKEDGTQNFDSVITFPSSLQPAYYSIVGKREPQYLYQFLPTFSG